MSSWASLSATPLGLVALAAPAAVCVVLGGALRRLVGGAPTARFGTASRLHTLGLDLAAGLLVLHLSLLALPALGTRWKPTPRWRSVASSRVSVITRIRSAGSPSAATPAARRGGSCSSSAGGGGRAAAGVGGGAAARSAGEPGRGLPHGRQAAGTPVRDGPHAAGRTAELGSDGSLVGGVDGVGRLEGLDRELGDDGYGFRQLRSGARDAMPLKVFAADQALDIVDRLLRLLFRISQMHAFGVHNAGRPRNPCRGVISNHHRHRPRELRALRGKPGRVVEGRCLPRILQRL